MEINLALRFDFGFGLCNDGGDVWPTHTHTQSCRRQVNGWDGCCMQMDLNSLAFLGALLRHVVGKFVYMLPSSGHIYGS